MILIPIISTVLIIAGLLGAVGVLVAGFSGGDDEQDKPTKKQQDRMVKQRIKTGQTLGNNVVGQFRKLNSDIDNQVKRRR